MLKDLLKGLKELREGGKINRQQVKCLMFYVLAKRIGKMIKDEEAKEEYFETVSDIWGQDGLF